MPLRFNLFLESDTDQTGFLSLSVPGPPIAGTGAEARELARNINEFYGKETYTEVSNPAAKKRLGFFAALPDWRDVNGTIAEIDFLYKQQKLAHGVAVNTNYGNYLLGNPLFERIWARLDEYGALVFLHPSGLPGVQPPDVAFGVQPPIVDFPFATTRAATDIVLTGTLKRYTNVDVVLSHAGGTLPYLGDRILGFLTIPIVAQYANVTVPEIEQGLARFYHDFALSTSPGQLNGLIDFTDSSKFLWGSDWPHVSEQRIDYLKAQWYDFVNTNPRGRLVAPQVLRANGKELLARHEQKHKLIM